MKLSRVCAIAAIGALIAVPVLAQSTSTSPSKTTTQSSPPPTSPTPGMKPTPPAGTSGSTAPSSAATGSGASTSKASKAIDINTASKEELQTLPGIGEARSDAIIKNRPYRSKDELVSKKIVPSNVYDGIKGQIAAVGGSKNTAAAGTATKK